MRGRREAERTGPNTTEWVLIALGLFWAAFVTVMIVVFCVKGSTPDMLIQCVLGGSGVEVFALTGIKVSKVLSGGKPKEKEECQDDSDG